MTKYKKLSSTPTEKTWRDKLTKDHVESLMRSFVNRHLIECYLWNQTEQGDMLADEQIQLRNFIYMEIPSAEEDTFWPLIVVLDAPWRAYDELLQEKTGISDWDDEYNELCELTLDLSENHDWITIFRNMIPSDITPEEVAAWVKKQGVAVRGYDPADSEDGDNSYTEDDSLIYINQGLINYLVDMFPDLVAQRSAAQPSHTYCNNRCGNCGPQNTK